MAKKSKWTAPPQWAKHLRRFSKRMFWKRERKNVQRKEIDDDRR